MVNGDYWIYSDGNGQTILARCEGTSSLFIGKPCSPSVKIIKRSIDQPIKFGASNLKFIVSASSWNGFWFSIIIANGSDEAAAYSVIRSVKVLAEGYAEKSSDLVSSNWRRENFLTTLGCNRMMLIFGTSQSGHYLVRHGASDMSDCFSVLSPAGLEFIVYFGLIICLKFFLFKWYKTWISCIWIPKLISSSKPELFSGINSSVSVFYSSQSFMSRYSEARKCFSLSGSLKLL